ncbi:MFS transporter [Acidiferrimicrobium sp. IK]|uniref:MFS transporter n=1 Tax=Acidiferrimicrobium sp. IK TaxID=2871700 RepID=UPI0021CB5B53|nr:MFS transporter [Acidiferrimicrobium sp. IK]MCU4184102.1 MFS transporter [Acidiferrimicrobium sp. IK]
MTIEPTGKTVTAERADATPAGTKWWTLVAVCLGTFMLLLDVTVVNVALPAIQTELHSTFADLQWVVDAYALTLAAFLLTSGSLADMFGRRLLYMAGLAIFTAASALCGAAQSPLMLELSRGLQGVGGAVMFSVSLALLASAFHGKERGLAFGVWGAITGVAVAIGPIVGGALVSGLSWRWIFFVNLPVGAVALAVTFYQVAESRSDKASRPDWAGFVLFTGGLVSIVYALIEAGRTSFSSTTVIATFAAGGVLLAGFLLVEARLAHPMFDLRLFRLPTFTGGAVAAFGVSVSIFSVLLYLTIYLQDVLGYSALQTGLRLLVLSGGILAVSFLAGRLTAHVPIRFLIGLGLLAVGGGLMLMRGLSATSGWTHLIPGMILGGVGVGFINPPLASTAVGVVTQEQAGMASGINSTFRQMGIATGIALLGSVFTSRLSSSVASLASGTPLSGRSAAIAKALENGQVATLFQKVPAAHRQLLNHVVKASFTSSLDLILLVAAIFAFAAGVLALALIRSRDFASGAAHTAPAH